MLRYIVAAYKPKFQPMTQKHGQLNSKINLLKLIAKVSGLFIQDVGSSPISR